MEAPGTTVMKPEYLARLDRYLRNPATSLLPPKAAISIYSPGRQYFLKQFSKEPAKVYYPPQQLSRMLWEIEFRAPLFNAAGMFKNGEGYRIVAAEGAGAYLGGTTTGLPRAGNEKLGVKLPFSPYPRSKSASNWLGLPNDGDEVVAARIASIARVRGCPLGMSVMGSPDLQGAEKLEKLMRGFELYQAAGVDFLELNESCPNVERAEQDVRLLAERLAFIAENFLQKRARNLPVIVKFSTDTAPSQVPTLLALLIDYGFDGVNFGNTSVDYSKHRTRIHPSEQRLFDYFISHFGGGVSGLPLREDSLSLVRVAANYVKERAPSREFHIIRTGGIETGDDVIESLQAGASLVQWYTGYFENFSKYGFDSYRRLFEGGSFLERVTATLGSGSVGE